MGSVLSRTQMFLSGLCGIKARILVLGLDGAGKTTILYWLKVKERVTTIPTVGFNVETLDPIGGVAFTVWDINKRSNAWPLWRHYLACTHGLVFVVDSKNIESHGDAKDMLYEILGEEELKGVPLIVLANKQDLTGAKSASELAQQFELEKWSGSKWGVYGCSAISGEGLQDVLKKLSEMVKDKGIIMS
ncbi:ADP-ribosylation factor 1-like 2 [Bombina bombina]|uniref:ADP-ribosylation factor 1-like 2 n=1 Tax=Bombina bombina TaxID=8345 RepID=UPI00235A75B7|nr:ADP-ribosylation factor 1-like 2 [Bombina bombina]